MKKQQLYFLLFTWCCIFFSTNFNPIAAKEYSYTPVKDSAKHLLVAGYLANYSFNKFNFSALPYINRIYYFSVSPTDDGQFIFPSEDSIRLTLLKSRLTQNQQLYIVIGGWIQSKNIPTMVSNAMKRSEYIKAIVQLCDQYKIDGVDLDWEDYPAEVDAGKFVLLCKDLSYALHQKQIAFSIALGVSEKKINMARSVQPYIDDINIMSYGKFDALGNQSPMNLFEQWLTNYTNAGIDKRKLIVGIPFYGKRLPDTTNHSPVSVAYNDIVLKTHPSFLENNYEKYSYNGVELIKSKTDFLIRNGYKGIMAWELSQDLPATSDSSLIKTIYQRIKPNR